MSIPARQAGIQALKNGDPKSALQHLAQAVQQDGNDAQAYAYLGTAYGQLNLPAQAAQCLERAVALAPHSAALQFNYGMALERTGEREGAVAAYRRSLSLDASYERAQQALVRLGQAGLTSSSGAAPGDVTLTNPSPYGTPPPVYHSAPKPYGAPPSVYTQEPTQYSAATQAAEPTVYGASDHQLQPMGDWTPPEPAAEGGLAGYQTAPRRPPATSTVYTPEAGAAVMTTVEAPAASMPKSWMLGHCYLSGMTLGAWWGLIGAVVLVLNGLLRITSSQLAQRLPPLLVGGLMVIAIGMLIFGVAGMIGGLTDDPEQTCNYLGIGVGLITSLFLVPMLLAMLSMGAGAMVGTVLVSRLFGKALGGRINELQANVFVVASAGDVSLVRGRR